MSQLAILVDGVATNTISLEKSKTSIGRSPQSDILIDDVSVSLNHAEIIVAQNELLDGYFDIHVQDLQSRNGTFVNGERIHRSLLTPNDVLKIGFNEFKLLDNQDAGGQSTVLMVLD